MKKATRFLALLSILILGSNVSALSFNNNFGFHFIEKESAETVIPFYLHNGLLILPVSINGHKELNFILDTGIRSLVLFDTRDAAQLKLSPDRPVAFSGAGGDNRVEGYVTHNVRITICGVEGNGISIVTLKRPFRGSDLKNIHGALGYQIFSRFIVKIDYRKSLLTLYEPQGFPVPEHYEEIPIFIEDTAPYTLGKAFISGDLQPIPVKLLIDTGFNDKLILFPNQKLTGKLSVLSKVRSYHGAGLGGSIKGLILKEVDLGLGSLTITGLEVIKPGINQYASDEFLNDRDGIIGGGLLSRFDVILNYADQKLYLKPHKPIDV